MLTAAHNKQTCYSDLFSGILYGNPLYLFLCFFSIQDARRKTETGEGETGRNVEEVLGKINGRRQENCVSLKNGYNNIL